MKNNKYKICHITSVHPRYDIRIFEKECKSLSKQYKVYLIVADGLGHEIKDGIKIIDVGREKNRIKRMFISPKKIYKVAKKIDSKIYHLHDPELISVGLNLIKQGKKVIFDAHEDIPKQILGKTYLNRFTSMVLSKSFASYEKFACKKFDYILTATPFIKDKFLKINKNSLDINNFPILGELSSETPWNEKNNEVCYIGSITKSRGINEVIKAIKLTQNVKLNLAGVFSEKGLEKEVKSYEGWQYVNQLGFLNRNEVANVLNYSKAGLVTLHPIVNYLDALPIKMFEYMAAGLPVISSDIRLWKEIVEGNSCGICVNPYAPHEIANAIEYIINNPIEAEQMGKNGRKAIEKKYHWDLEEKKLLRLYMNIIG